LITVLLQEVPSGEKITLPIIGSGIDLRTFFFIAPIIILANYVYLYIYLQELSRRINEYKYLTQNLKLLFDPNLYLYHWLFVFSRIEDKYVNGGLKYYIYNFQKYIALFIPWWIAPVVQIVFWISFISQQDIVSLIPFFCMVLSTAIGFINTERAWNKGFTIIFKLCR
jgi:hypothetical protein